MFHTRHMSLQEPCHVPHVSVHIVLETTWKPDTPWVNVEDECPAKVMIVSQSATHGTRQWRPRQGKTRRVRKMFLKPIGRDDSIWKTYLDTDIYALTLCTIQTPTKMLRWSISMIRLGAFKSKISPMPPYAGKQDKIWYEGRHSLSQC